MALQIVRTIWRPLRPRVELRPHELVLGVVNDPETGANLDQAMAVVFPAPDSFTGEDVTELHCHGGRYIVRRILSVAVSHGARMAEPGEFSRRAFLNGKIDLAEAEAIADLVAARGEAALAQALANLSGDLSKSVNDLRAKVIAIRAHLEAEIDFADEDIALPSRHQMADEIERLIGDVARLHDSFTRGRLAREGVRVAIIGKPNVGKSSLMNALLGVDRAIVTAIPGTTRDTIEDTIELGGYPIILADTAGIRASGDEIERMGIARTWKSAADADLILATFDSSVPLDNEDLAAMQVCIGANIRPLTVAVLNKSDLPQTIDAAAIRNAGITAAVISVSALTGDGIGALRTELAAAVDSIVGEADGAGERIAISRERHRDDLAAALKALKLAHRSAISMMPPEIVAVDIGGAADALGRITGEVTGEDVLDAVFREFCIGK